MKVEPLIGERTESSTHCTTHPQTPMTARGKDRQRHSAEILRSQRNGNHGTDRLTRLIVPSRHSQHSLSNTSCIDMGVSASIASSARCCYIVCSFTRLLKLQSLSRHSTPSILCVHSIAHFSNLFTILLSLSSVSLLFVFPTVDLCL